MEEFSQRISKCGEGFILGFAKLAGACHAARLNVFRR
jgi:hypothetical protein